MILCVFRTNSGCQQGSRKWDPWDPVGSDVTYLVGKKKISTQGRMNTTHSGLDKLTADWTNCSEYCKNCPKGRTEHSMIN